MSASFRFFFNENLTQMFEHGKQQILIINQTAADRIEVAVTVSGKIFQTEG
jgi:hypothetical protein